MPEFSYRQDHKHDFYGYAECVYMSTNEGMRWVMASDQGGVIGPCPDSDKMMSREIGRLTREMNATREVNASVVAEYESMGGQLDLTMARIEHLMNFLVEAKVITELQHVTEQRDWEKHLRPQVIAARDGKREEVKKMQKLADEARTPKPADRLIVPPHVKRKRGR